MAEAFPVPDAVRFAALAAAFALRLGTDPSLLPLPLIGRAVPAFSLPPVKGRQLGLASADLHGEVSLVNVFASWCVACREEHPVLMQLKRTGTVPLHGLNYKDRPDDAARWPDTMGDPYTRTGADLDGRVGIDWGVYGVPETFVVDAEGLQANRTGHVGESGSDDFAAREKATAERPSHPMKPAAETNPQDGARPGSDRPAKRRWPLIAAIGLTVIGALGLAYALATVTGYRYAAPVPLSPQAFSFPDQPVAVADLKFVDGTGKPVSLSDFRGRPLLLNIWATWCLPCRKEMPSLDRLQAKFAPQKFLVLPLSIDRGGIPAVEKFYEELGLKSVGIYVDQTGAALYQLGLLGIPATLLINPEGREVGRKLGPAEWDSAEVAAVLREHLALPGAEPAGAAP